MKKLSILLALILFTASINSCRKARKRAFKEVDEFQEIAREFISTIDQHSNEWQGIADQGLNIFEGANNNWLDESNEFQVIFEDVQFDFARFVDAFENIQNLLPEAINQAGLELERVTANSIGLATQNFLCASDALEGNLHATLNEIFENIGFENNTFDNPIDHEQMVICGSNVSTLDLSKPLEYRTEISFTGYNFPEDGLEIIFTRPNGLEIEVSDDILYYQGPYRFLLILSNYSDDYLGGFHKLSIVLDSELYYELPIIN